MQNMQNMQKLYVIKRDGHKENIMFDKITSRIKKLCYGLNNDFIDETAITFSVISGLYPGVTTIELDNLAAETAAGLATKHPDYAVLAARIAISNLHKQTKKSFSETMKSLYEMKNEKTGKNTSIIAEDVYQIIMKNKERLDSEIIYDRDFW